MNLKEQLAGKVEIIGDLKLAVESGDEAAADQLSEAMEEAKGIQARIAEAEAADEMLKGLENAVARKASEDAPARSLGEFAAKSLDVEAAKASGKASTGFGFKAATDVHVSTPIEVVDQKVVDVQRNLAIRGLFGSETISGTSLKYFVLGATEGAPAVTAENAQKPQFHVPYAPVTKSLSKIAGWYYETDELIEDNAFLRSSIDNRGLFELDNAAEAFLVADLLATSGIQTLAPAGSAIAADDLFKAITNVKTATNYDADAIVINPADYQVLRLAKDGTDGQYYGGGYFYGPYGNNDGRMAAQPGIWGLNTVVTTAVAQGTCLVGAFRAGASVVTKGGEGVSVEVVTGDHDDRTNNRVTVVVEERLLLATRVPAAFVKVA